MTFYQELQLNQAGSKSLLKNSKTMKEKLYHAFVYMVKIAVTMVFCFAFVTASSIILGKDNSIVGVVDLLCVCNYDSMSASGKSAFTASGAAYKHCSSCSADFVRMP